MFCAYTRPRYQVNVYRTIGHLGLIFVGIGVTFACDDFIFYVILKKGCLLPGKLTNCH